MYYTFTLLVAVPFTSAGRSLTRGFTPMHCRAVCTDCGWTYQSDSHEVAADRLERHARKEQHHVKFRRVPSVSP